MPAERLLEVAVTLPRPGPPHELSKALLQLVPLRIETTGAKAVELKVAVTLEAAVMLNE